MKKSIQILGCTLGLVALQGAVMAADIGVSVNISQPGFYGRIDVGSVPQPVVIYPQPVIIQQHPNNLVRQPIYLRVRPGHEKHWDKHCARYNACGQPVYFVQDRWYQQEYAPRHMQEPDRQDGRRDDIKRQRGHNKENRGRD
jgi:hypothetical protein